MVSEMISHYRILNKLGAGGMGEVYLAEDTRLGRKVALKLLPEDLTADEQAKRRFIQEAKAASALNHPNIITIYDIASEGQRDFIAMEYVEGETLRGVLSLGKVEIKRALELAAQAASGLAAAHQAGIVHRDIKPENLMVTRTSQVKILDFGLAKLSEKKTASLLDTNLPTERYRPGPAKAETAPGTILGTVSYMSPEQAQGHPLDHRTDVFSLGVILYEMLTGQRPFRGKTAVDTLHAIINAEPRPAIEVNPRLPAEVMDILGKALAKEVGERYQHAGDFELDLRRLKRAIESNSLISVQTKLALKPRAWWASKRAVLVWSILGVLLVVGGMVAAWLLGRATAGPKQEGSLARITLMPLTVDPNYDGEPTFSPSGEIAYVTNRTGNFEIFRKLISGGAEINLTQHDADDVQPAFSPDGTQIAFVSTRSSSSQLIYRHANFPLTGGDIWIMPALGGPARRIVEAGNFPSWSPDGSSLIYAGGPQGSQQILSVPASGGEPREIPLKFTSGNPARSVFYPSYSSDGGWIVFEKQQGDEIYVVSAAGGEPQQVARGRCPVWNANSTAIIYASGEPGKNFSLWQVPFALKEGKPAGQPTPLTVSRGRDTQAAVSRDGKLIAFAAQDVEFNIEKRPFDAESGRLLGEPTAITSGHSLNYFLDVSPDGRRVVFESHRGASHHLWSSNEAGLNQLTSDANFDDTYPKWSPDGLTIGFVRKGVNETDVKDSLWIMSADGVNPQPLHPEVRNFRWLPDGQRIVYHSPRDRQFYLLDVRAKSEQRLTNEPGAPGIFSISPDGQWVVYQSTLKGTVDVRAVPISGGPSQAIVETPREDYHPFVSPSGKWLYFQPDHKNLFRVPGPAQGWRKAEPEKVTDFPESGLFLEDPQISRDGRWLFYSHARITGDIWIMRLGQ
jgi:Tol biopolymer transport system component/predicted Ser/Thr protein kinase